MCVNAPDNHATTWPDLRRVDRGLYVLNDEATSPRPGRPDVAPKGAAADPRGWPWEGHVQLLFGMYLHKHGWSVTSLADTASKAPGVDLLATKGPRRLGAEVKGWPSGRYADPRRAHEVEPTAPTTRQALVRRRPGGGADAARQPPRTRVPRRAAGLPPLP